MFILSALLGPPWLELGLEWELELEFMVWFGTAVIVSVNSAHRRNERNGMIDRLIGSQWSKQIEHILQVEHIPRRGGNDTAPTNLFPMKL